MKKTVYQQACERALEYYGKAHIILSAAEKEKIEVANFGLNDLENTGL